MEEDSLSKIAAHLKTSLGAKLTLELESTSGKMHSFPSSRLVVAPQNEGTFYPVRTWITVQIRNETTWHFMGTVSSKEDWTSWREQAAEVLLQTFSVHPKC